MLGAKTRKHQSTRAWQTPALSLSKGVVALSCVILLPAPLVAADDPLARARLLYNQRQFEEAVTAAEQARLVPAHADLADLVAARAYLERFRQSAASDDLTNARDRLSRIDPAKFPPRERVEYIVGLAEALFFDDSYGAAAAVFDSVLLNGEAMFADWIGRISPLECGPAIGRLSFERSFSNLLSG